MTHAARPTSTPRPPGFSAETVRRARLDNGLTVLVQPEPEIPSLAYFTAWRVGSRNERPGITGISHLFEHLMFNGARKYGPQEFDRVLESNGGYSNAYTSHDVTVYHETVPSDRLSLVLDLELDRMRDLDLSERTLESEREVVKEERRMRVDESPQGTLREQLHAIAHLAHPYGWPVIGWMADIEAISVEDLKAYHAEQYVARNAVVAVVGAVDPDATLEEIDGVLGVLREGAPQRPVVRSEPEQVGQRRIRVHREAHLPLLAVGFHAPESSSPDLCAVDVLQCVLGDGDSSRLHRGLVLDRELAVDVHVSYPWALDPSLFTVAASVRPDVDPARLEDALFEELARLAASGPTERELQAAKNVLDADFHRQLKTNEGTADRLCEAEILFGGHEALFDLPSRVAAVRAEDVQRLASELLRPERASVAQLEPRPGSRGADAEDGTA